MPPTPTQPAALGNGWLLLIMLTGAFVTGLHLSSSNTDQPPAAIAPQPMESGYALRACSAADIDHQSNQNNHQEIEHVFHKN
jgi:hypothetical protein